MLFVTNITASEKEHAKSDYPAIWHEDTRKAKNVAQALQFLSEFENNIDPKITSLKSISIRNLLYQNTLNIEKKIKNIPLSQIKYQVKRDRIFLKCYAHQDGFIRLSHPVYKGLEIELNGIKAVPLQDDLGMMLLPVTKGDIKINIYATKSSLRRNLSVLSNFLLFIIAIYLSIRYISKYKKHIRVLLRKIYFKTMKLYQKAFF